MCPLSYTIGLPVYFEATVTLCLPLLCYSVEFEARYSDTSSYALTLKDCLNYSWSFVSLYELLNGFYFLTLSNMASEF